MKVGVNRLKFIYLKSSNDIKVKHMACNVFARLGCWQLHVK